MRNGQLQLTGIKSLCDKKKCVGRLAFVICYNGYAQKTVILNFQEEHVSRYVSRTKTVLRTLQYQCCQITENFSPIDNQHRENGLTERSRTSRISFGLSDESRKLTNVAS